MIFYTLQGPGHQLEIHEDKLLLVKKRWLRFFRQRFTAVWQVQELSHFEITVPKYIFWGKIEWKSFDGTAGSFRFSTNAVMVKKIELYLQKRIIKNYQHIDGIAAAKKTPSKRTQKAA